MTLATEYILRVLPESYSLRITLILSVGVVFFTNLFEQRSRAVKAVGTLRSDNGDVHENVGEK